MKHFLTFLFLSTFLFSNEILSIKQDETPYILGYYTEYFVDQTDSLSLNDVSKKSFIHYDKAILNFGFLAPTYWFKIKFSYDELMLNKKWWLSIDYPLLDFVDMFVVESQGGLILHKKSGDLYPKTLIDVNQNTILFSLPNNSLETYTLYFKVKTSSSMLVPMQIISNKTLLQNTHINQTLSGIYYGILFILILYNSIIFFYTKEKIYVLYILFVISYALWQLSFDGMGTLYFWDANYWMREKGAVLFIYTSSFTLLLFSQTLLNAKKNIPKFNQILLEPLKYIAIAGVLAAILLPYKYTIVLGALLGICVPVVLFIGGLIVLRTDYYSVRLFVVGWGIFLISTVLFTLSKFNLMGGFVIMKYAQQIGSAIDMILISGALAERFKRLQSEYTQKLKNHNKDLKKEVHQALKKERQKDQILLTQSRSASMGEMIEQIAHQWRQPLNNIGLLNQDLYFKKQLGTLEDKYFEKIHRQIDTNLKYMSDTIDDFRTYYRGSKEKEIYCLHDSIDIILSIIEATLKESAIEIVLNTNRGIRVNNIKNELFQVLLIIINNAKDVLVSNKIENKQIRIELKSDEDYAYISIEDNGLGIPKDIILKYLILILLPNIIMKEQG